MNEIKNKWYLTTIGVLHKLWLAMTSYSIVKLVVVSSVIVVVHFGGALLLLPFLTPFKRFKEANSVIAGL